MGERVSLLFQPSLDGWPSCAADGLRGLPCKKSAFRCGGGRPADHRPVRQTALSAYISAFAGHSAGRHGAIIINSSKSASEFKPLLKGYKGKVYTCDARTISEETLGKNFPNTPMLGAVVKVSEVMEEEAFLNAMEESFKHKFASKPEVLKGNMEALTRSMREVKE